MLIASSEAQTNEYLNKHQLFGRFIETAPHTDLRLCVVIPVYDEPELARCVASLSRCAAPSAAVEVLLVVNDRVDDSRAVRAQSARTLIELKELACRCSHSRFQLHPIDLRGMTNKHAGVGLARKAGMDEAVRRLVWAKTTDGVIVSLDADCSCHSTYLQAIERHFDKHPRTPGCSIYFEHPLSGQGCERMYAGVARYELGLRYYKNALANAGFPFARYTVGSAMAVRDTYYQAQGGMNQRQAGEDFYFLQKFICLGGFTELNATVVYPSARVSTRVPFGTGRAQQRWLAGDASVALNFSIEAFKSLAVLSRSIPAWYDSQVPDFGSLPQPVTAFLEQQRAYDVIPDIQSRVASKQAFVKRVYRWLDAFAVFKYLKWSAETAYPKVPVEQAVSGLLEWMGCELQEVQPETLSLLLRLRESDRDGKLTGVDCAGSSYN